MDASLCEQKIRDLEELEAFRTAVDACASVDGPSVPQQKLLDQMQRFGERLAQLKGQNVTATQDKKRSWAQAVSLSDLPGSDRVELTSDTNDKTKGLRKQYAEVQHHYVAHKATSAAVEDAQKALEGTDLPILAVEAFEFVRETALTGADRALKRAKLLALVSDKGPELGWKIAEIMEVRPYAENEEEDKAIRKAEKLAKAEKATPPKHKHKQRERGRSPRRREDRSRERGREPDRPEERGLRCFKCQRYGHIADRCPNPRVGRR